MPHTAFTFGGWWARGLFLVLSLMHTPLSWARTCKSVPVLWAFTFLLNYAPHQLNEPTISNRSSRLPWSFPHSVHLQGLGSRSSPGHPVSSLNNTSSFTFLGTDLPGSHSVHETPGYHSSLVSFYSISSTPSRFSPGIWIGSLDPLI